MKWEAWILLAALASGFVRTVIALNKRTKPVETESVVGWIVFTLLFGWLTLRLGCAL